MDIKRYENAVCAFDAELFGDDEYAFSVLARILRGACRLTLTDAKSFVICHSAYPYPVWLWTARELTGDDYEEIYSILKAEFLGERDIRFNTGYEFADFLIKRAAEDGIRLGIAENMLAYKCERAVPPKKTPGGRMIKVTEEYLEEAAGYLFDFSQTVGNEKWTLDGCRTKAMDLIKDGRLFFRLDGKGAVGAMASLAISENKGCVGSVYIPPEKRRHGYASCLVYGITRLIMEQGKIPTLYTDADYAASNACYTAIGYVKMGSLCSVKHI